MKTKRLIIFLLVLVMSIILAACGWNRVRPSYYYPGDRPGTLLDDSPSPANGELIYFTATSDRDGRITYRGGPNYGGMMIGAYLTCAACHGPSAQGGWHTMHMSVMNAPDIRIVALMDEEAEEHDDEHGEYDLDAFRMAVVNGQHPDGDPLNSDMPRWQISDSDLVDLFAFLQSLP